MLSTSKKYGVDKNGFILTKASLSKIKKPFAKIVSDVKDHLLNELKDQIHSIYIYGSVASGEAKVKTSDLDILVVFKKKPSPKPKSQIENLSENLSKKYKTLVREVGVAISDLKEVGADTYGWGCFIKHLCVDIYGKNLSSQLPKFKPTKKVAEAFNGDCGKVVEAAIKKLSGKPSKKEVLKICSSTMRKIVRTGFSLVMEKEKSWTTDLKKSYLAFAKYYPKQKSQMKMVLELALTPTSSKKELIKLLKELRPLLVTFEIKDTKEVEKCLGKKITLFELKASGDCNDAYYVETENGKKFIVKKEKPNKDFIAQNSLGVEATLIKQLSKLNLSVPIPKVSFVSKKPDMFSYEYIEGEPLISLWKNLSKKERIRIGETLGKFHAEIGQKVTKQMAKKCGVKVNNSSKLHPEVEKDYNEILTFKDIPAEFKSLAKKAKTIFDQTLDLGVFQFIHNDAHHENIIIKNKKIAGIIDFGESEFGEIAKEFSRYIRDFHDDAEYIIKAYEKASENKLSRKRLITNSFLSGLMENVEDYRKGGRHRLKALKSVQFYKKMIYKFKIL